MDSVATSGGASFIAIAPGNRFAYVSNEGGAMVSAFAIDRATGALSPLNRASSRGTGPAHVGVDRSGHWVLVANYDSGDVASLAIGADGRLGAVGGELNVGMNAHLLLTDLSNRFAFVPCLGSDYVAQLSFDATSGALMSNNPASVSTAAGAGPRHLAFHPNGRWVFLINETDNTLTALSLDPATGLLTAQQTVSTLPAGFSGASATAEIQVHPSGRWVYGSNRGHDSIVQFAIDASGQLSLVGHTLTGGQRPRHFSIDPSGELLFVGNQSPGNIVELRIDPQRGTLTSLGPVATVVDPQWAGAIDL